MIWVCYLMFIFLFCLLLFSHLLSFLLKIFPYIQISLNLGIFCVSPCNGNVQPGAQQQITVVCLADQLGSWNQGLLIDIVGRDPSEQPDGIAYRLLAEVCRPGERWVSLHEKFNLKIMYVHDSHLNGIISSRQVAWLGIKWASVGDFNEPTWWEIHLSIKDLFARK